MPRRSEAQELLSDEDVRKRLLADPAISARAKEVLRQSQTGVIEGSGVGIEELSDFLREHGLDARQGATRKRP